MTKLLSFGTLVKVTEGFYRGQVGELIAVKNNKQGKAEKYSINFLDRRLSRGNPYEIDVYDVSAAGLITELIHSIKGLR